MATGHLLTDQLVGLGPLRCREHGGADGCPSWREFVDLTHIQVAMEGQGQGSGDRGSGHREQVGLQTLVEQSVPLVDAEAVLLIHHHQSQAGKHHRILQQGMGPHQNLEGAVGQVIQQLAPFGFRRRAGKQLNRHVQWGKPAAKVAVVLFGQNLRRCHQGALPAGADGAQQRRNSHDGFTGTDIPLHQPCHRLGTLQIGLDFAEDPLLCGGEGKGQGSQKLPHKPITATDQLELGTRTLAQGASTPQQT